MLMDPRDLTHDDVTLRFDDDGAPTDVITMIDLDGVTAYDKLATILARRPDRIGLIGMASQPLPPESATLLAELTFTLIRDPQHAPQAAAATTVVVPDPGLTCATIAAKVTSAPRATVATFSLLAVDTSLVDGLVLESFAYSMLLGGPEFAAWRSQRTPREIPTVAQPVRIERSGGRLDIVLDHTERRNAFSRHLRAELIEALHLVELDPSITEVVISGDGTTFSSGGDLDEFGQATDLSAAHAARLAQSAGLALHRVADRATVVLHGTCFGAGIEVPAFAGRVLARPGTTVCLPELGMGLLPGAGGTASIRQRIGQWRTAYMVLSGAAIDVDQALDWGLVDELVVS